MRFRGMEGGVLECGGWGVGRCWMDGCLWVMGGEGYGNAWGVALVDGMIAL